MVLEGDRVARLLSPPPARPSARRSDKRALTEHGERRIAGSIDLLLETPAGFVIIDHKSYPGSAAHWESRGLEYAPQLMTYAKVIQMAGGAVIGKFVHFTIGGGVAELVDD